MTGGGKSALNPTQAVVTSEHVVHKIVKIETTKAKTKITLQYKKGASRPITCMEHLDKDLYEKCSMASGGNLLVDFATKKDCKTIQERLVEVSGMTDDVLFPHKHRCTHDHGMIGEYQTFSKGWCKPLMEEGRCCKECGVPPTTKTVFYACNGRVKFDCKHIYCQECFQKSVLHEDQKDGLTRRTRKKQRYD